MREGGGEREGEGGREEGRGIERGRERGKEGERGRGRGREEVGVKKKDGRINEAEKENQRGAEQSGIIPVLSHLPLQGPMKMLQSEQSSIVTAAL